MQAQTRELVQGQPVLAAVEGLFRHKHLFTILFSTIIVAVAIVTLATKRQYRSEMKFLLENNRSNAVITSDRSPAPVLSMITEEQINSELEVLSSEDVLDAIADPSWSTLPSSQRTPAAMEQHENRLERFRKGLTIIPARKASVIYVGFTAASPLEATDTLERFSSAYLARRKQLSRPSGTLEFFNEETARYKQAWQKANTELVAFQQANGIVSVQDTEQTLTKEIAGVDDELRANQVSLSEAERRLSANLKAASVVPPRQQTQQHTILSQSAVDQMRTLLVQLQNRRTELLTRYNSTDRLVTEVTHEIADTTASLNSALAQKGQEDTTDVNPAWQQVQSSLVEGVTNRQALHGRAEALRQSKTELQNRLQHLQPLDVRFNALQEQDEQARNNFKLFAEKRDQAQIEDAMDDRKLINIAVAENATTSPRSVSPNFRLNAGLGLLTALFLAGGAVYFAESLRTTVASARELEAISRYPVLATVPHAVGTETEADLEGSTQTVAARTRDSISASRMIPAMQNFGNANET